MFGLIFCRISLYFIAFLLCFCIVTYRAVSAIAFLGILIASCVVSQYALLMFFPRSCARSFSFSRLYFLIRLFPFFRILARSGGSFVSIIMRMCLALIPKSSVPAADLAKIL